MNELTQLLEDAAAALAGKLERSQAGLDVRLLIATLGYADGEVTHGRQRAALLKAAARLKRLFRLQALEAPGLVFFGGEADPALIGWRGTGHAPISLAGSGLSVGQAFESCVAEGVEYLSQFEVNTDVQRREAFDHVAFSCEITAYIGTVLESVGIAPNRPIDWVAARNLRNSSAVWLPADICLRRSAKIRDFAAPFKLSTGCGAATSFADAVMHGLCELIERDAVALWWRGGRLGHAVADDSKAGRAGAELLASLRRGSTRRTTWLLDITTDVTVPCVAAISMGTDGRGFACGHAARPTYAAAVRSAILEMCQIELGQAVIEAKRREGGEETLNAADRTHLRRANLIDAAGCALLRPAGAPVDEQNCTLTLPAIVDRLGAMGIEPLVIDLTRPVLGIPVARVVAPGLQLEPCAIMTGRLAQMISRTGGGEQYTGGVPLL